MKNLDVMQVSELIEILEMLDKDAEIKVDIDGFTRNVSNVYTMTNDNKTIYIE